MQYYAIGFSIFFCLSLNFVCTVVIMILMIKKKGLLPHRMQIDNNIPGSMYIPGSM